jgi:lipopolysaccharide export system ATP-binding protein
LVDIRLARDEDVVTERQAASMAPRRAQIPQTGAKAQARAAAQSGLVVEGLRKSYKRRPVVRDVSLSVRRGEAVGLLGPNGAGKTTVFYMITGLIAADSGRISLDGTEITHLPMYRRARLGIGYLAQESSIFRGLTVEENIRAVLELTEGSKQKREAKLRELLDEFSITHLRNSPAVALSGGERRRVEIARALAADPEFMLLDEPFAGIDPIAISDIRKLVRQLTSRGIGVLVTDHNVRETLELIDKALIIHEGQVLTEGTPEEIVSNPDVRRYYLGADFSL